MHRIRRRGSLAFGLIEVMLVSGIMTSMYQNQASSYRYVLDKAQETKGLENLRQVYLLLVADSASNSLPDAAFYPKGDPLKDPKSIVKLIPDAVPELFVSPFAPDPLKKKGLTYAWNDSVNGKDMSALPKDTWLLIDLAAFIADPGVPAPQKYLLLYADGRALAVTSLPPDIDKAVREARAKIEAEKAKSAK